MLFIPFYNLFFIIILVFIHSLCFNALRNLLGSQLFSVYIVVLAITTLKIEYTFIKLS